MHDEVGPAAHEAGPRGPRQARQVVGPCFRMAALAAATLALANCTGTGTTTQLAGGRHASELKYGVKSSPRVIPDGQPIPKGGGREMVGQPYVVAGRSYRPHGGAGYDRKGEASWYGTAFHGRLTANGEIFDRESIAAAHPTLPLPSYVRVSNLSNGRSMIVRVNDRGPYERGRIIDLSERAADALGFRRRGTEHVRVQYVGKAPVAGSDDERLMATLRERHAPASLKPVQIAEARNERRGTRTEQADDVSHVAPKSPGGAGPRLGRVAAESDAAPADVKPPRRPRMARAD